MKKKDIPPNEIDANEHAGTQPEKQRKWANKLHDGDKQRNLRGNGPPKPTPKKRASKKDTGPKG